MRPVTGVPGVDFTVEDVRGAFPDELEIEPLARPVDATVRVPGSKSVTNRALLIAALANGTSTIKNTLFSDDSYWLMHALVRLGFAVRASPSTGETSITGESGIIPERELEVFVGNAGTVARFLPPALALGEGPYVVDGTPRMRERRYSIRSAVAMVASFLVFFVVSWLTRSHAPAQLDPDVRLVMEL